MPAVARALRTGGSNRSSPAPTQSQQQQQSNSEKDIEDVELESGEDGSPPAKKRKQKNPEKSHVEKMKAAEQEAEQAQQQAQQQQQETASTTDETHMDQDDLVDQMVADEQQMLNEEVVETVVLNEEEEENDETVKSEDDNDLEGQEKKSIQIRIASNGQSEEGEDPSQGKFVVLEKENGQNAPNEQLSDDDDVKNQEVDHETTVEMEQIVEDDETVELTPYTEKSHNGHSGHILTTIPAGQHIQSYEMIDGDNTQQGDMVMVLQQQLIQMPRSEAYRLGYIHPNSIGSGHPAGAQFMMPAIVAGQPTVMPVAQLGNLGQVAIMSPSQVVVQQSDLNTCDTMPEDQQQQQGQEQRQEQPAVSQNHGQVVQQSDQPQQQQVQQVQQREMAPDELELEELTKKAVTSKTCQQLTVEEAQKLVDSQQCRPVTIRSNYDGNKKLKFDCIFCPLMSHIYKKDINRSFSYKESLRRHYEQHFNYALNQHRCTEKLPDGTPCPYNCKRSDHLDRHREKIHALSRADKGKQNRRAIAYHGEELDENGVAIAYHGEEGTQHAIQFSNENNIELNLREGDQGCIRLQAIQLEEHQGEGGTTQTVQAIPVVTTAQSINGQTIITQQLPEGTTVVNEKGETLVVQQVSQQVEVSQMEMDEVKPLKNEVVDD